MLLSDVYQLLEYEWPDPRTSSYPMSSCHAPLIVVVIFLSFVYYWGPKLMKDRKPYKIKKISIVYNILQMLFNGYLVINVIKLCYWPMRYSLWCQPIDKGTSPRETQILNIVWLYYMSKIIDIIDTVFIIIRKKYSQLTLLHIYHHSGMIIVSWIGLKYAPGGQSILAGFINCFVHVVMYGYYLLTAIDKRYVNSWWKRHITQLQLLQFGIICGHHVISAFSTDCGYPRSISLLVIPSTFSITYLFAVFYWQTYINPREQKKQL